jgi:hypothetical protein
LETRALFAGSQGGTVAPAGGNTCDSLSARLDLKARGPALGYGPHRTIYLTGIGTIDGLCFVNSDPIRRTIALPKGARADCQSGWASRRVTRLDRLARSTRDLLNTLDAVAKAGAGFKSLKDTWADTTTPHGRLMLTVLGGLAEFERELIRARTDDGRRRAQARGVRFGRPLALTAHQRQEAIQRLCNGEAQADVARSFNVSQATISRLAAPSPFEASAAGL